MTSTEERHNIEYVKQMCRTFLTEYIILYHSDMKELWIEGDITQENYKKLLEFYIYGHRMFCFVVTSIYKIDDDRICFSLKMIK